ncbi:MAG: ATP-binding cassette domain-containing protein [Rikenellaceae bacterium]|nr:ATP-binding cassette domain-containing protein [Rikenellaceae bacterium]
MSEKVVIKLQGAGIYHAENPNVTLTPRTREKAGEKVLENLDLEVAAGEIVYLIGRVGSGKSSLLKTLYGELPLVEGMGNIAGFDLTRLKRSKIPYLRRKVAMVFQELILLSDRNAHDNLLCALQATGWKSKGAIEHRIEEVLTLVGLKDRADRMPFELSGGERQRLIIARALLNSPEVILADEPTVNLDPVTAEGIIRLFHEIAAKGTAVIISTHNISLIENYPSTTLLFAHKTVHRVDVEELISEKSTI